VLGNGTGQNASFEVVPEAGDPFPATYGAALSVYQPDHTKLDMDQFFHGLAVAYHTNNPGPTNQNAAVLGFTYSHGGADPFGADFHAVVPSSATSSPTYAVGVQAETQVDRLGSTTIYPLLISHNSSVGKKAAAMIYLTTGDAPGTGAILLTAPGVMTDEGILLRPANDSNPTYRAFAVTSSDNSQNMFAVQKDGKIISRGGYANLIHTASGTEAGIIVDRVGDSLTANREYMVLGSDARVPNAFEIQSTQTGTGTARPVIFTIGSTEKARFDSGSGILLNGTTRFTSGSGVPNGSVIGSPGDLYTNTAGGAGTTLYVKETGAATNTGWVAK
jgi:hypothetical protein